MVYNIPMLRIAVAFGYISISSFTIKKNKLFMSIFNWYNTLKVNRIAELFI